MNTKIKYDKETLANIICDICHAALDFKEDSDFEMIVDMYSHMISCFIAQNTKFGDSGVESNIPYYSLEMSQKMSVKKRKKLAMELIESFENY